jgi:nucleoside-diphosphate-sugar epimerase
MIRSDAVSARPVLAITGATGFIGQAVLRAAITDGWQPRLLVRRFPRGCLIAGQPVEIVLGDLNDAGALQKLMRGAKAVIHLAGLIKALRDEDFFTANAGGTENLLMAAAAANPTAPLLHVSSLAAREPQLSPYAASKRAGEEQVQRLAGDRPWAIIRPPAVYGPGDPATLPLFKAARSGFLPYPAAADARVSLIHVADLASAILAATQQLCAGGLATGTLAEIDDGQAGGHRWAEMIEALALAAARPVRSVRLPRPLLVPIAAANAAYCRFRKRADVFMPAKLAELYHRDWAAAGPGLPETCHWQPGFTLQSGFADTFQWYRNNSFTA